MSEEWITIKVPLVESKEKDMAFQFSSEVEPQPMAVREKKIVDPPAKRMPRREKWTCSKCGERGHVKSACRDRKVPPSNGAGLKAVIAHLEEDIARTEADLRDMKRVLARLGGTA